MWILVIASARHIIEGGGLAGGLPCERVGHKAGAPDEPVPY